MSLKSNGYYGGRALLKNSLFYSVISCGAHFNAELIHISYTHNLNIYLQRDKITHITHTYK